MAPKKRLTMIGIPMNRYHFLEGKEAIYKSRIPLFKLGDKFSYPKSREIDFSNMPKTYIIDDVDHDSFGTPIYLLVEDVKSTTKHKITYGLYKESYLRDKLIPS